LAEFRRPAPLASRGFEVAATFGKDNSLSRIQFHTCRVAVSQRGRLEAQADDISKLLARSFQSGHVNFLIGSGASFPAIPSAGDVEKEIAKLFDAGDEEAVYLKLYDFLLTIQLPTNKLIAGISDTNNDLTASYYSDYLNIVESILGERRTSLLPKQATIFTTNYDLFIEKASISNSVMRLNDGFVRVPSLTGRSEYSSRTFFTTTSSAANLYNYKVDIPCVNLMKIHVSLSWKKDGDDILFSVISTVPLPPTRTPAQVKEFVDKYAVVLPETRKFHTTLMDNPTMNFFGFMPMSWTAREHC